MADESTPLLVPVAAEALVVNDAVRNTTSWSRWQVNYSNLGQFNSPNPAPFSQDTLPDPGIHLRWALPSALTNGTQITAAATATIAGGRITAVEITNGGFGYLAPPLVEFTSGGGRGAIAEATITDGVVTAIDVVAGGSGYTSDPNVAIGAGPQVCFPLVPNRWLVVRYEPGATPTDPRSTKTWLIKSDTLNSTDGPNPFVNPDPANPDAIDPTYIGEVVADVSTWQGDDSSSQAMFLRAVGPGDATFHAYTPGIDSVFALYDDLGQDYARSVDFTYVVVGWYSDQTKDPIYGPITSWQSNCIPVRTAWTTPDEWHELLAGLNWATEGTESLGAADLPAASAYHAQVSGVQWNNVTAPPWNGNNIADMTVAVGHTAVDAMAALIEHGTTGTEAQVEAESLEALQYGELNTIDDADGSAQLDLTIHGSWFGSSAGGTVWTATAIDDVTPSGMTPTTTVPVVPPLTLAQQQAVAALNRSQRQLDTALRQLTSLQGELYDAWWKLQRAPFAETNASQYLDDWQSQVIAPLTAALSTTDPSSLYSKVVAAEQTASKLAASLPPPTDQAAIAKYAVDVIKLDPTEYQLRAMVAPRFYQPVDPVILVKGLSASEAQGKLGDRTALPCRLISQTVTGVEVAIDGTTKPVDSSTGTLSTAIPTTPTVPGLPTAIAGGLPALVTEAFFVDPIDATPIVELALGSTDTAVIDALAKAMAALTAQTATIADPLAAATAFDDWSYQPFSPLFLEWQISYFYTVDNDAIQDDNYAFAEVRTTPPGGSGRAWTFDGSEYDWYGGNPVTASGAQSYVGRTFLTPQSIFVLERRLDAYLKQNSNAALEQVQAFIDQVGEWNFLSQRLSGLNDQMIMQSVEQHHPPGSSIADMVGSAFDTTPNPTKGDQDTSFGEGTPYFFPTRGGFIQMERLQVVDVFGQAIDLMKAGGNVGTGVSWIPIRGRGLAPSASARLSGQDLYPAQAIKLPPRIVQEARLDFRFTSATDDSQETGQYADASPVCGWVLPNHLDGGLAVFDAHGAALGELIVLQDVGAGQSVAWLAAPESSSAAKDPSAIPNEHLKDFVLGLTTRTDQGQGFVDLLSAIDETLWTIDPLGGRDDQNLSVLIGRPLALVRAQLQFELKGNAATNQSWRDTQLGYDANMTKIEFAVRLGSLDLYNDGLLGYFSGTDYSTFNPVHTPSGFSPSSGAYLDPIGNDGNYLTMPVQVAAPEYVTMLLDPRGEVHARTGVLPTKSISLPANYFEDALAALAVTFRTGPVLAQPGTIRLPYPAERHGNWSWVQRATAGSTDYEVDTIVRANQNARLPNSPPRLIEGWLRLVPKDDS